ncbi:MAG: hypothetical protein CCU26_17390 [Nitrospira sp. UW-LDO-01]|nr:MAG: hypothetical protein CCU26_17390 [Nitrospira sp. UW-LDO-01]
MNAHTLIKCTVTVLSALWLFTEPTAQASVVYNLTGWDSTGTGGADGGFPSNWVGGPTPTYTGSLNAMWYANVGAGSTETVSSTDARSKGADPTFALAVGPRAWNDNTSGTQGQGHGSDFGLIHFEGQSNLSITVAADASLGSSLKPGFSLFQGWDVGSSSERVQPFQNNADNPLGTNGLLFQGSASTTTSGGNAVQLFTNLPAGTYTLFVGGNFAGGTGAPGKYTVSLTASPVPLPAAAWLFGSGVIGMLGLARRQFRESRETMN